MPSASAVWVWYQLWNTVSIPSAYRIGIPSRSRIASRSRMGRRNSPATRNKYSIATTSLFWFVA